MKHIPLLLSLLTTIFLIICFFQIRGRGMGFVPPETDWELHPGVWWHFNFLANCGEFLIELPSFFIIMILAPAMSFLSIDLNSYAGVPFAFSCFIIGIPIVIESLLVFYIAKLIFK